MATNQTILRDTLGKCDYPKKFEHWVKEHHKAVKNPIRQEKGLLKILEGVAIYGDASVDVGTKVGEDGYAAEYILDILRGVVGLLSAETGRLDCGTVDKAIRALGENLGFNRDLTE
jgi:hypothetical protein